MSTTAKGYSKWQACHCDAFEIPVPVFLHFLTTHYSKCLTVIHTQVVSKYLELNTTWLGFCNPMEHSPPLDTTNSSSGQETSCVLLNSKVHYRKSPTPTPFSVHTPLCQNNTCIWLTGWASRCPLTFW